MPDESGDLGRLRTQMDEVETEAQSLHWAEQRPWRRESHIWLEADLPVVDLHDLNMRVARIAVRAALEVASDLDCGAICFVTGRGRHSTGAPVLRGMVAKELRRACQQDSNWSQRAGHAGRWMLVTDSSRAPRVATGQLGLGFWFMVFLFLCLAAWALVGLPA